MKDWAIQLNDKPGTGAIGDLKVKVKLDAEGKIVQGITVGEVLEQNIAMIMMPGEGEYKMNPDIGVSIKDMLFDNDFLAYRHRIREHLAKDGIKVQSLAFFENQPFKIEAGYE